MRKIFAIFLLLSSFSVNAIVTINTEKADIGHNFNIATKLKSQSDESESRSFYLDNKYKYQSNDSQIIINQSYDYAETDDLVTSDNFFSHLRYIENIDSSWNHEYFHQYSNYTSRNTIYRQLIGGGISYKNNEKVLTGLSIMAEEEKYSFGDYEDSFRFSIYSRGAFEFTETSSFGYNLFYQPKTSDLADNYRLLALFSFSHKLSEHFNLLYNVNFERYQNPIFDDNIWYKTHNLLIEFTY